MEVFERISPELAEWIGRQPLFFNAPAPLNGAGHINLSPRGLDTRRIVDSGTVLILDLPAPTVVDQEQKSHRSGAYAGLFFGQLINFMHSTSNNKMLAPAARA